MSGEVGCCSLLCGNLVGVFVFRVMCVDVCIMFSMRVPLWFSSGECHRRECAFISAVMMLLVRDVMCVRVLVMSWSSRFCDVLKESFGGMYRFAMCMCWFLLV